MWFLHFMNLFPFIPPKIAACMDQTFEYIFKSNITPKERTCRSPKWVGPARMLHSNFQRKTICLCIFICCLHYCLIGSTPKCSISAFKCKLFYNVWNVIITCLVLYTELKYASNHLKITLIASINVHQNVIQQEWQCIMTPSGEILCDYKHLARNITTTRASALCKSAISEKLSTDHNMMCHNFKTM
jgi:hypothetical protein